ncbi:protein translocase subunit SecY [Holospora obtusa F1]|uniref:Protein translocase subunit SecY n=1 Tax=Holospora obtusa F1 TaxID=1399147 RepID=W6TDN3_HOLOB|nr:preprotein translocase subunit SecY [Holospora obtusa]ETZ07188.1 protein translocase subunit SecY [Holospora obtusa F1]
MSEHSFFQNFSKYLSFDAFLKASDLHKRIFFTLWIFVIYRLGTYIPLPGIDPVSMRVLAGDYASQGILKMFNIVSGGALERMSIFALNLGPYISSSIIVQLMTAIFPNFIMLKKEGESGRRKLSQYTRYGTIALATVQAAGLASLLSSIPGLVLDPGLFFHFSTITTIIGATLFLMWLGERITAKGIGNGSSMLIYAGIIASLPQGLFQFLELGRTGGINFFEIFFWVGGISAFVCFITFMEKAYYKVGVQYSRRPEIGTRNSTERPYIPLKLNPTGVLPPIFSMALLGFFYSLSNLKIMDHLWIVGPLLKLLFVHPVVSIFVRIGLIIFFAFFYTSIVFNPEEKAKELMSSHISVHPLRPGVMTANYFTYLLNRLTVVGSIYIASVVVLPDVLSKIFYVSFPISGTSVLIAVSVTLETTSQFFSHIVSHQYSNLFKKQKRKIL